MIWYITILPDDFSIGITDGIFSFDFKQLASTTAVKRHSRILLIKT